ncbi:MAG: acylneuraminate cytidylyltransferase [Thaumarchaeota archaeon]|nr:MAG: acylneuraminate cytidylyltransferase [Nitrososphaerota archaeon]
MKSICFIPARGGSKEIPKKNIRILSNKPLIAHAIETALESQLFENVIVSTDDSEIAKISKQYGAEIPFMRPKEISADDSTFDEVLLHCVKELQSQGYKFDIITARDCTVPFIDQNDMKGAIDLLLKSDCDSVFTVCRTHPNPYFGMFETTSKGFLEPSKISPKPIKRRQDAPIVYELNGLYVHSVKQLLQTGKMFTDKILPYEITKEHGFMIDHEIEFKVAEIMYDLRKQSKINF